MTKKEFHFPYQHGKDTFVRAPIRCPNCGAMCAATMTVCTKCKTDLTKVSSGQNTNESEGEQK